MKSAKSWFSLCRLPIVKEKLAGKWSAAWLDGVTCFESEKAQLDKNKFLKMHEIMALQKVTSGKGCF